MTRRRHSKCHDCPYREQDKRGICKVCRIEDAAYDEATLRRKFAKLRAKQRSGDDA